MLNVQGGELLLLIIAALVIFGPSRMPEYAAKLGQGVRYLRDLADSAKGQIRDELGPGFEDIDWRQLDPRQYDPRRIVRDALTSPAPSAAAPGVAEPQEPVGPAGATGTLGQPRRPLAHDPGRPTPFDVDAT